MNLNNIVLCFHRVSIQDSGGKSKLSISPQKLVEILEIVSEKYEFSTLEKAITKPRASLASVTFDDGYADNLYTVLPILEERKIPTTFFISTYFAENQMKYYVDLLDVQSTKNYWRDLERMAGMEYADFHQEMSKLDHQAGKTVTSWDDLRRPMDMAEIALLESSELVSLGLHTHTHRRCSLLSQKEFASEIEDNQIALSKVSIGKLKFFAYPFGQPTDFHHDNILELKRRGVERAFTTFPSAIPNGKISTFNIPRLSLGNWSRNKLKLILFLMQFGSHLPRTWYFILQSTKFFSGKRVSGSLLLKSWQL